MRSLISSAVGLAALMASLSVIHRHRLYRWRRSAWLLRQFGAVSGAAGRAVDRTARRAAVRRGESVVGGGVAFLVADDR